MSKVNVTIQARLKVSGKEKEMFDNFMRHSSLYIKYFYKKFLEEKTKNELKKKLQNITKDVANALVIARRGFGFFEKFPKNYKNIFEKSGESPQCESGTVLELTDGRNSGTAGKVKTCLYNPWRMLRVAVLTALSPERCKTPKCLSPLKQLLVSGEMGRTRKGREVLLPGTGPMDAQIPPAGAGHPEQRRITNTPAPNCILMQFG